MKFELVSGNEGFTVVLAEISSNKRLDITNLKLEDPSLLSKNSIESEIKRRVAEHFGCNDDVSLEMDRDTERKIYRILLNNIEAFESE